MSAFIKTLRLANLLSYGPTSPVVALEPLNVLIGPNASGKSNFIEAIGLLQATPGDVNRPFGRSGVHEWIWKGDQPDVAEVEATIDFPHGPVPLRYKFDFASAGQSWIIVKESLENAAPTTSDANGVEVFYRRQDNSATLAVRGDVDAPQGTAQGRSLRKLAFVTDIDLRQSILSQRKDPDQYPEVTYLGRQFSQIKLYRDWNLGRHAPLRSPQPADRQNDFLLEPATNLGLVVNALQNLPATKRVILDKLRRFYDRIEDIVTITQGGTIQIFIHEAGLIEPIPATRLSDGTLRYLCLLTLLCHPNPPPVTCIEEPELGLHPDVMPIVAELLIEASHRTQLFVTTHSDALVSALTETPQSIIVCERHDDGTSPRRLDQDQLREWLEKYTLGDLWRMGEIGGTLS